MKNSNPIPPVLIARTLSFLFQGRIHRDKQAIGTVLHEEDEYVAFRKFVVDPGKNRPEKPGAMLRVTFNFKDKSLPTNVRLSRIPIPLILGQPGFRSKTWFIGKQTEKFQGLYEWDSVEAAENYLVSFTMKMMKRRANLDTLEYKIWPVED